MARSGPDSKNAAGTQSAIVIPLPREGTAPTCSLANTLFFKRCEAAIDPPRTRRCFIHLARERPDERGADGGAAPDEAALQAPRGARRQARMAMAGARREEVALSAVFATVGDESAGEATGREWGGGEGWAG
jgi:hypothetical protein